MKKIGSVGAVLVGKAVPFARDSKSGIDKKVMVERQLVDKLGFINDEQGDLIVHGGIEKALHIYPSEHYGEWQKTLNANIRFQHVGAFGENISSSGLDEHTICIEDKIRIGTTLLQVSQGRMPCWKLNERFEHNDMAVKLQHTLRTGWYFRVLEEGTIGAGDDILLCERSYPDRSVARIMSLIFSGCLDKTVLLELLALPLVDSWRRLVERRLENGVLEDWSPRLMGP
ncbi:MOSC domain-containing protein [Moritella sp. Urea-trap-13]|uniref:MOSC domain-containing protein n=1 Tax=Moritella sp. Urea-trap-13 TaxID=2058327 RepID=UPI000C335796|nr:MOSC domain-containing protein [Moritella sp. Urea-trap-13]PKH07408.1 MOSC domain-containing protein [Moritella sp. Urea-trap-13]